MFLYCREEKKKKGLMSRIESDYYRKCCQRKENFEKSFFFSNFPKLWKLLALEKYFFKSPIENQISRCKQKKKKKERKRKKLYEEMMRKDLIPPRCLEGQNKKILWHKFKWNGRLGRGKKERKIFAPTRAGITPGPISHRGKTKGMRYVTPQRYSFFDYPRVYV